MTKAAKAYGKRLQDYLDNKETKLYVSELGKLITPISVIKVQRGNGNLPTVGTWGHPKLAVRFAQWLSFKFAVFSDMVIDDLLEGNVKIRITRP